MTSAYSPTPAQDQASASDSRPTIKSIIREIAEKHGTTREAIISPRRGEKLCLARFEAFARCKAETGKSLLAIGKAFNRHHTSVIYGIWRFENPIEKPERPKKPKKVRAKIMTPERVKTAIGLRTKGKSWVFIANKFGCSTTVVADGCYKAAKENIEYRAALEKYKWFAHQAACQNARPETPIQSKPRRPDPALFIIAPVPETRDNKLTGTPSLSRSSLYDSDGGIKTDSRGNLIKPTPVRVNVGAINIPDIRISAGHQAQLHPSVSME